MGYFLSLLCCGLILCGPAAVASDMWNAAPDAGGGAGRSKWEFACLQGDSWDGGWYPKPMSRNASTGQWECRRAGRVVCSARTSGDKVVITSGAGPLAHACIGLIVWTAPEGGYYRIHGTASAEVGGAARLNVRSRRGAEPILSAVGEPGSPHLTFEKTVLLNQGDRVLFWAEPVVAGVELSTSWEAHVERVPVVPEPWTPLEVDGASVRCWNREYRFENSLLPSEIASGGVSLLSGPMRISVRESGREALSWSGVEQEWRGIGVETLRADPDVVTLLARGSSDLLEVECSYTIEFDGMMLCDLVIRPRSGPVEVRRIDLNIPLRPGAAKLFHHAALKPVAQWNLAGDPYWSGAIPDTGLFLPFTHHIWVGDEDRGLDWFTESDETLSPLGYFASIYPDSRMVLSLSGLRTLTDASPFRFRFGLMATPVKPMLPVDRMRWAWQIVGDNHLKGDAADPTPVLQAAAAVGTNCSFAGSLSDVLWHLANDAQYRANWKRLMTAAAEAGIDIGCAQSWVTQQPYNDVHHNPEGVADDWLLEPRLTLQFPENPIQDQHLTCQNSPFSRWFLDASYEVLLEHGAGGMYLDGPGIPQLCANLNHGCGYVDARGVHPTFPIFATREIMKQLYFISRLAGKRVVAHMSGTLTPATLSFADAILGGEHIADWYPGVNPRYTLASFRAEIVGRQYGLPAFWLYNNRERPTLRAALSLLHGILPLWGSPDMAGFLKAYADFGAAEADWIGYWRGAGPVRTDNDEVLVSSYVRPGRGALAVIANLGESSLSTALQVDCQALKIERAAAAEVMSAEASISGADPGWVVELRPGGWMMVRVSQAE